MKRSKRFMAMLMVLALCLTMIPAQVFAENLGPSNDDPDPEPEPKGPWTITFVTGNDTTVPDREVADGSTLEKAPDAGARKDYKFKEWNTKYDGSGTKYSDISTVTENITFYAIWETDTGNGNNNGDGNGSGNEIKYTILLDYNGATGGDTVNSITVVSGEKLTGLPKPTKKGYTFKGWYTNKTGNSSSTKYENGKVITSGVTLYAVWTTDGDYTVTFNYEKGQNQDDITEKSFTKNDKLGTLPRTKRTDYELVGWFTKPDGMGEQYTKDTKITGNVKLYAFWMKDKHMKVTFNYEGSTGGDNVPYMGVDKGDAFKDHHDNLPTPTKENYSFEGWYTEKDGKGDEFTKSTKVSKDVKLYAYWVVKDGYTVKFDYQGADSGNSEKNRVVEKKEKIGSLPNPKMSGYNFQGWYTEKDGKGEQYTNSTKVTENLTLYAYFKKATIAEPNTNNQTNNQQKGPFNDVKQNDWFCKPVEFVTGKKLFSGMGDGNFAPQDQMTRAMFVTVMGKMAEDMGLSTTGFSNSFSDVGANEWYSQYVSWAASNGLVEGYSEWQFGPNDGITREQMASLFVRFSKFANVQLGSGGGSSFNDAGNISGWAKDDVNTVVGAGLMQGSDGNFNPKGNATRAEVATVFMNLSEKYVK